MEASDLEQVNGGGILEEIAHFISDPKLTAAQWWGEHKRENEPQEKPWDYDDIVTF